MLEILNKYLYKDFSSLSAKEFQDFIHSLLYEFGQVRREVRVSDKGDGRGGRVDLVLNTDGYVTGFELDRKVPRHKSRIKLLSLPADDRIIITRDPFTLTRV